MNTSATSTAISKSQSPADELLSDSKHHTKFALCVSAMLAVIAFAVYCFFIDM
jgi:hypothetical protein